MSFCILTLNYGRPQVFKLFCASTRRLREQTGYNFPVIVVSEPNDAPLCEEYGLTHIIHPNIPVTEKWNRGIEYIKQLDCEYVVITGSDDIWSTDTLLCLVESMKSGVDMIGIRELYVYDADGLSRGKLIKITSKNFYGVGKAIHRRVLEKVDWKPWVYHAPRNWGMDSILYKNISPFIQTRAEYGGIITDVKSKDSLNNFSMFERNHKGVLCPHELFYSYLSKEERTILDSIIHIGLPVKFPNMVKRGRRMV